MDILHRNPFVRHLIPFAAGILLGNWLEKDACNCALALLCCAVVALLVHLWACRRADFFRFRWLFGVSTASLLTACGCWLTWQAYARTQIDFAGQPGIFRLEVLDAPEEKPKSVLCKVAVQLQTDSVGIRSVSGKAVAYLAKDSAALQLCRGDILMASTSFEKPTNNGNPCSFDYARYLQRQGIAATAYLPAHYWQKVGHSTRFSLMALAQKSRNSLLNIYRRFGIGGDEFAVLAALTLGYKDSLEPELQAHYAASGAMHILAVSGLHVGIIFVILGFLLSFLDKFKHGLVLKAVLIVILLWAYAFLTGLSPSVLRSALMFSFISIGNAFRRKSQIYNTIAISAFLLLLFNPLLLFSVGFQLSYSAVVAILYFQPKLSRLLFFHTRPMRWLWNLLCVSVAAQLGTAPWALLYFNQFSNYFLLTNILAIPAASLIIYTAVLMLALSPMPLVAQPVAWLLGMELKVLNGGIRTIGQLPHSVSAVWISPLQAFLLLAGVLLLVAFLERKRLGWLWLSLGCVGVFFGINLVRHVQVLHRQTLTFFADGKADIVQQTDGCTQWILTNEPDKAVRLTRELALRDRLDSALVRLVAPDQLNVFVCQGQRYALLSGEALWHKVNAQPLVVDYLLVGNVGRTRPQEIMQLVRPKQLIALESLQTWKRQEIERLCAENGISFYNIAVQGAWRREWPLAEGQKIN